ncbi:hypothetical protein ACI797_15390 [Geodermatophilus sp. SYSU D00691]
MCAEHKLTAEQLAALAPGDAVTVEISGNFRRPRVCIGIVVRLKGSRLVVSTRSDRGVGYVHRFDRRDGVRVGDGHRAGLVNLEAVSEAAGATEQRQQVFSIDAPYREWVRKPSDVDRLHRRLQEAVNARLKDPAVPL